MKAPPTSQTVLLANPENAHLTDSDAMLNPGLARSCALNKVQREIAAVSAIAMKPVAAGGTGSMMSAATTPATTEKNHHACWPRPGGDGISARQTGIRTGIAQRQYVASRPVCSTAALVASGIRVPLALAPTGFGGRTPKRL